MNNNITKYIAIAITLVFSSMAFGHGKFLTDLDGNMVTDGFGECVSINKLTHRHGVKHSHCDDAPVKKAESKPAPKPKPAPPAPKPVVHENITLGASALFDTNKADLRPAGIAELDTLAFKLKSYFALDSIAITGHTDSRGAESYNQGLSERRAAAVKAYLVSRGIRESAITTSGAGESSPVASNDTAAGRQKNRRVEINISARK